MEYDEVKNQKNIRKHHISIPELATIFSNPFAPPMLDIPDKKHSKREKRYHAYGWTTSGFYVKIWYTYRDEVIRIIGGRKLK
nr:BrnT family toxin [Clostridia bacterium]